MRWAVIFLVLLFGLGWLLFRGGGTGHLGRALVVKPSGGVVREASEAKKIASIRIHN